ncbi:fructose-bisphosphate aldolase [Tieghemostelium lacteum]|uniref:Fructose-bisphosphate aldolase n=1 Tax=Tieghemostelium lacteum TaxID=361077 RepID=A0A152A6H7_TIELA|nr:fructose-bisphosphate aldolase [Tieghemostelium lacteum]|eukprot:KYR01731.1 fructose-bisphosphate aldolase [Tieghemostelium lacteum]
MSAAGKYTEELIKTANLIASPGKGILAADESTNTIGQRFQKINLENNEANRRAYRELLIGTNLDIQKHISGVILYEETLYQKMEDGTPFVDVLKSKGIQIGIKVDKGTQPIPGTDNETSTQGLDGLGDRCKKYYEQGARFAKWRAVLKIDVPKGLPSQLSITENAHTLARYAAICQENGLVPIVEPEILMDGEHSIEDSARITEQVLAAVFKHLNDQHVLLEGALLKPNMVLSGTQSKTKATPAQVGKYTSQTLKRTVPPALPGIVFLSGGQTEIEATENLNAINLAAGSKPWSLTFSYGRALQASVIKTWNGDKANVDKARDVYLHRAKSNSLAQLGKYEGEEKTASASESLFVSNYKY